MKAIEQVRNWIFGDNDSSPRARIVNEKMQNVFEDYMQKLLVLLMILI
jgi:hypothetical protein